MCIKNLYAIDVHNIFENINILPRILYYSHDLITYKKNINIRIFDEKVINKNYFPPTDCMSSKPTADVSENFFFHSSGRSIFLDLFQLMTTPPQISTQHNVIF